MEPFVVSQVLALLAFAFGISSFQFKTRKSVLLCWFGSALFNGFHFLILEEISAGVLVLITSTRFLTAAFSTNRKLMYLFIVVILISFSLTDFHAVSFLALFATLAGTYGAFHPVDIRVRFMLAVCSFTWAIHNTIVGSPIAVAMETSFLVSNLIGWWRFYHSAKVSAQ